jgi:hypothetical protein
MRLTKYEKYDDEKTLMRGDYIAAAFGPWMTFLVRRESTRFV